MKQFQLTWFNIFAYTLPAIPSAALGLPLVVYLPPFYAEEIGLGLSLVGTIFMITRFWDVFTDPIVGIISDRVTTRLGRRRHWIILSVPILMVSVYQVFLPANNVDGSYLLFWLLVLYVGYTLLMICHIAWGAELSDDYHDRSTIQGWREFAVVFGMLAVLALPAIVENLGEVTSFFKMASMGWFVIIFLPITVTIAVFFVKENPREFVPLKWQKLLKIILKNRLLQWVLLADLLTGIVPGIAGSLYIFYIEYVLNLGKLSSVLLLIYFAAGFIGIPFWIKLSHRYGKHQTFTIAMIYTTLTLPLFLLIKPGIWWLCAVVNLLYGLSSGAPSFLLRAIIADVGDHDKLKTGNESTGLYYSLLTMTNKIGYALAVGITYPILDWIGFIPGKNNSESAILGLKNMFILMPIPLIILAGILMVKFPLDAKKHQEIRQLIAEKYR
jgi:glycoside/pentoside/hexuronide:cation symporter, GPH family